MESDDSDTYDAKDEIFKTNKYLHRFIFPDDPKYQDDYDKNADATRIMQTNVCLKRLYDQLNMFHNWELLPVEIRCLIVEKMDFMTRLSLMITSKNNNEIVRSVPMIIEKIVLDRDKTLKSDIVSQKEEHIYVEVPPHRHMNTLQFWFVESGEDTKLIRKWFKTTDRTFEKKTMLLKNSDYIKESELFVERLLILSNHRLDALHVKIRDWGQSLNFFDKLRVKKELDVNTSGISHVARLLDCGNSSLNKLSIDVYGKIGNTSFLNHKAIKNAKKLSMYARILIPDSFFLNLNCKEFSVATITTNHAINTFVKRWIDGGGPENFRQATIMNFHCVEDLEVLKNIEYLEWDDQFKRENHMLHKWVLDTHYDMKYYYIESKKRNNGATLAIRLQWMAFMVTGKRWSPGDKIT